MTRQIIRQIGLLVLFTALAAWTALAPAKASDVKLEWTPGWDVFDQPLDYNNSFVSYNQPASPRNKLNVVFHLEGAAPNASHLVGIHVMNACPASFGQFPDSDGCGPATRQGNTAAAVQAFELGILTTDETGEGDLAVQITGIASGVYQFEFDVRIGNQCNPGAGCSVIYQSPGPFAVGTATITVP